MSLRSNSDYELSSDIADFIRGHQGHEIGTFIDRLSSMGDCAIFGGLPRDFAHAGRDGFDSDVDVVVDAPPHELDSFLSGVGARRNRFGGFRFKYGRFDFDVWALNKTWAVSSGHVKADSLRDLIKTTFFDCDAVIFHCSTSDIVRSENFWDNIRRGVVDINLEANPHYIGTLVRTLKIISNKWRLAERLSEYLIEGIKENREAILEYTAMHSENFGGKTRAYFDEIICTMENQDK